MSDAIPFLYRLHYLIAPMNHSVTNNITIGEDEIRDSRVKANNA